MPLLTANRTHADYGMTITDATGNSMMIDIPISEGGTGKGMRPMHTLLAAFCGCSAVDVVSILKKQKQEITDLQILVDGDRETRKEPSVWQSVELTFKFKGNIDNAKAYRAVELSVDKYCSVAETLRRAGATIHFKVFVNEIACSNK